jgi:hypothetical protein
MKNKIKDLAKVRAMLLINFVMQVKVYYNKFKLNMPWWKEENYLKKFKERKLKKMNKKEKVVGMKKNLNTWLI